MATTQPEVGEREGFVEYLTNVKGTIDYVIAVLNPAEEPGETVQEGVDAVSVLEYLNSDDSQFPGKPQEDEPDDPAYRAIARMMHVYEEKEEGMLAALPEYVDNIKGYGNAIDQAFGALELDELGLGGSAVNGERTRMLLNAVNNLKQAKTYLENILTQSLPSEELTQ